jgi:hypothetical protein
MPWLLLPGPSTVTAAALLELQRSAGNQAVTNLLHKRQRELTAQRVTVVPSWSGTEETSWNKRARSVTRAGAEATAGQSGVLRIPVEGMSVGHAGQEAEEIGGDSDPNIAEDGTPVKTVTSETVGSGEAGRAIVLIPPGLARGPVDILFHLHGHTIGYRQVKAAAGKAAPPPRDVQYDRIAQQLLETGAKMIAILPQGKFKSGFGPGEQKGVNVDAYVGEVFALANLADYKPGRITLSGWSGAGAGVAEMIKGQAADKIKEREAAGKKVKARDPSASLLPESSHFEGLFLFDALYGNQGATVWAWLETRLESEVGKLVELAGTSPDAAAASAAQIAWIHSSGFRFRGIFTAPHEGHYKPLRTELKQWFISGPHLKKITKSVVSPEIIAELHKNYQVVPAGEGVGHNAMIGGVEEARKPGVYTHENLAEALQALPPATTGAPATPAQGRAPTPVRPATTTTPGHASAGTGAAGGTAAKAAGGRATVKAAKAAASPSKDKGAEIAAQYTLSEAERTKLVPLAGDIEALDTAKEELAEKAKASKKKKLKAAERKELNDLKKEVNRLKGKVKSDRKKFKGDKGKATLAKYDIEQDLMGAGVDSLADWYKDIDTSAHFLGVSIRKGIHKDLRDHLEDAEKKLKTETGIDDVKKLANELHLTEATGLRSPKPATGGSRPSMHCYGLAVDLNYTGSPFVGNVEAVARNRGEPMGDLTASHAIARAMLLIHQEKYDIIDRDQVKENVGKQYDLLKEASGTLETYFALPGKPKELEALVDKLKKSGKDTRDADAWRKQIEQDHAALTAKGTDFSDHADPEKGFVDLDKRMVLALTSAGLYWGGMYGEAKDVMHFDWRAGTIKRS